MAIAMMNLVVQDALTLSKMMLLLLRVATRATAGLAIEGGRANSSGKDCIERGRGGGVPECDLVEGQRQGGDGGPQGEPRI